MKTLLSQTWTRASLIGIGGCIGVTILTSLQAQQGPVVNTGVGRYMLTRGNDEVIYCIDTQTGAVWAKVRSTSVWRPDGNPPQGKDAVPYNRPTH